MVLAPIQLGKWLVLFCDEINLPDMDKYGTFLLDFQFNVTQNRYTEDLEIYVKFGCLARIKDLNMNVQGGENPLVSLPPPPPYF